MLLNALKRRKRLILLPFFYVCSFLWCYAAQDETVFDMNEACLKAQKFVFELKFDDAEKI